ncbi:MAG: hypothetical protein BGO28_01970 [Alphaproteobacteria bacterium 43-37]|nr:MAG: hypothetical protein BGO28_01970 [Alphaproteobacteria bacterium 43-37]
MGKTKGSAWEDKGSASHTHTFPLPRSFPCHPRSFSCHPRESGGPYKAWVPDLRPGRQKGGVRERQREVCGGAIKALDPGSARPRRQKRSARGDKGRHQADKEGCSG